MGDWLAGYADPDEDDQDQAPENPVLSQMGMLEAAFRG
jgi:hypothetical protein